MIDDFTELQTAEQDREMLRRERLCRSCKIFEIDIVCLSCCHASLCYRCAEGKNKCYMCLSPIIHSERINRVEQAVDD